MESVEALALAFAMARSERARENRRGIVLSMVVVPAERVINGNMLLAHIADFQSQETIGNTRIATEVG